MIHEKDAGYLTARLNCASVLEGFLQEGGTYRQTEAKPGCASGKTLQSVKLSDGTELAADQFVFACGPWLGKVFPDVIGDRVAPSRQQVFFFGAAPGDSRFGEDRLPGSISGLRPFTASPAMNGAVSRLPMIPAGQPAIRLPGKGRSRRKRK
jgi:glycine/D-amino acid oxidase-like deaminating enzyme